jgi:hypothetical protein
MDVRIADDFPPQVTVVQSHYDDGFGCTTSIASR